jgi:O-antigen/teichoic acid export membrane protein
MTAQACRRTVLVTSIMALGIALLGPFMIVLWYGQPFAPAGEPLGWAAVAAVMLSIYVVLTRAFTSRNRQLVNITVGVVALVANVGLNIYLIPRYGIVGAAGAVAVTYSVACLLLIVLYLRESRQSLWEIVVPGREDVRYMWDTSVDVGRRALHRVWHRGSR